MTVRMKQMAPIKQAIHIPIHVYLAIMRPQEGDPANPFDALKDHANACLDQLTWWARALKAAREEERLKRE